MNSINPVPRPDIVESARSNVLRAAEIADRNGNGNLATQEVNAAGLTKVETKLLHQAISLAANSEGGQSVENVKRWVNWAFDEFKARDTDRNLVLTAPELSDVTDPTRRNLLKQVGKAVSATVVAWG